MIYSHQKREHTDKFHSEYDEESIITASDHSRMSSASSSSRRSTVGSTGTREKASRVTTVNCHDDANSLNNNPRRRYTDSSDKKIENEVQSQRHGAYQISRGEHAQSKQNYARLYCETDNMEANERSPSKDYDYSQQDETYISSRHQDGYFSVLIKDRFDQFKSVDEESDITASDQTEMTSTWRSTMAREGTRGYNSHLEDYYYSSGANSCNAKHQSRCITYSNDCIDYDVQSQRHNVDEVPRKEYVEIKNTCARAFAECKNKGANKNELSRYYSHLQQDDGNDYDSIEEDGDEKEDSICAKVKAADDSSCTNRGKYYHDFTYRKQSYHNQIEHFPSQKVHDEKNEIPQNFAGEFYSKSNDNDDGFAGEKIDDTEYKHESKHLSTKFLPVVLNYDNRMNVSRKSFIDNDTTTGIDFRSSNNGNEAEDYPLIRDNITVQECQTLAEPTNQQHEQSRISCSNYTMLTIMFLLFLLNAWIAGVYYALIKYDFLFPKRGVVRDVAVMIPFHDGNITNNENITPMPVSLSSYIQTILPSFAPTSIEQQYSNVFTVDKSLTTTFDLDEKDEDGNALTQKSYGNTFELHAHSDVIIRTLSIHVGHANPEEDILNVNVYTKASYMHDTNFNWTNIVNVRGRGKGLGTATKLPESVFTPTKILRGATHSFYVTLDTRNLVSSIFLSDTSDITNTPPKFVGASNEDMELFVGKGIDQLSPFIISRPLMFEVTNHNTTQHLFHGKVYYSTAETAPPSNSPTTFPSLLPSELPSLQLSTPSNLLQTQVNVSNATSPNSTTNFYHPTDTNSSFVSKHQQALSWSQLGNTIWGDVDGNYLGTSVSMSAAGNRFAVLAGLSTTPLSFDEGHKDFLKNRESKSFVRVYEYIVSPMNSTSTAFTSSGLLGFWEQIGADIELGTHSSLENGHNGRFRYSISLSGSGNCLAIGTVGTENGGVVRVYQYQASSLLINEQKQSANWIQLGSDIVLPRDDGATAQNDIAFGQSVSLSDTGNRLAIGAPPMLHNFNNNQGFVYVFDYKSIRSRWMQVGQVVQEGGEVVEDVPSTDKNTMFGHSISLSPNGNIFAVGAPVAAKSMSISRNNVSHVDSMGGYVRVYAMDTKGEFWSKQGSDISSRHEQHQHDLFGHAIAIAVTNESYHIAIGAPRYDHHYRNDNMNGTTNNSTTAYRIGRAVVYRFNHTKNEWILYGSSSTILGSVTAGANAGYSVDLSRNADTLVVGIPGVDTKDDGDMNAFSSSNRGKASILLLQDGQYGMTTQLTQPEDLEVDSNNVTITNESEGLFLPGDGTVYDVSISNDGSVVVVGLPMLEDFGRGHVRVYSTKSP